MTQPVTVVIPTFNNWHLTKLCLDSWAEFGPACGVAEVIVVDNGSTDDTREQLLAYPSVKPILNDRNYGFAHACNQGASASSSPLVFLFNNDAYCIDESLRHLIECMHDPTIGVAGARLLYDDGTIQHAGMVVTDDADYRWTHIHRFCDGRLADANVARDYPAVTGAAMLFRRTFFEELGGFDTGYLNGYEDVDFAMRVWSSGHRVRYEPRATFVHVESASAGRYEQDIENFRRFHARWKAALALLPGYPYRWSFGVVAAGSIGQQSFRSDSGYEFFDGLRQNGCYAIPLGGTDDLKPEAVVAWNSVLSERIKSLPALVFAAVESPEMAAAYKGNADAFLVPTKRSQELLRVAGTNVPISVARLGCDFTKFNPSAPPVHLPVPTVIAIAISDTPDESIAQTLRVFCSGAAGEATLAFVTDQEAAVLQQKLARIFAEKCAGLAAPQINILQLRGLLRSVLPGILTGASCLLATSLDPEMRMIFCALASGTPIVALDRPPLNELLYTTWADLVMDEPSLGQALKAVLKDPRGARRRAEIARLAAARRYGTLLCAARAADAIRRELFDHDDGEAYTVSPGIAQAMQTHFFDGSPG